MHVACVIVTFNRLLLLRDLVEAVTTQTTPPNSIIIVDNASTDGTTPWIQDLASKREDVFNISMSTNWGGAGGFHFGIKKACEIGAEWIWTMDDDTAPQLNALENLLTCGIIQGTASDQNIGFLSSRVNWKDGNCHQMNVPGPSSDWTAAHKNYFCSAKIRYSSFVSILINRYAIMKVGLPIKEFFIYCDDVEFTRRITSAGFSAYYVPSSLVVHMTAENQGITMERIVAYPPPVRNREYIIRNLISVNRREPFGRFKELARIFYIMIKLIANRTPLSIQTKLFRSAIKGFLLDYERWIEFPDPIADEISFYNT